jgi:hypothetical protein
VTDVLGALDLTLVEDAAAIAVSAIVDPLSAVLAVLACTFFGHCYERGNACRADWPFVTCRAGGAGGALGAIGATAAYEQCT